MLKLFRGEKSDSPPTPPRTPPPPPADGDSAGERARDEELETLGQVLRYLGEEAFDVADDTADHIAAMFSAWSRHLLVLAPHPDEPDEPVRHRDFIGLRRFVQQFRHREVGYVKKTLKELRSVLWVMVGQLGSAVLSDRTTDKQAKQQLARLQRAVGAGSLDELQREAMATVDCLNEIIEQRRAREQKQVEALREQIQAINEELTQTRQEMVLDPLTRLFNRGALDERLERTACLAALTGQDAALFMVDLDHFKQVNDTHGHPVGDLVLKAVADACVRCFPRQRDFVARYGGEEIAIVGFDAPVSSLKMLGERILAAVRAVKVPTPGGAVVTLTASVGVAPLRPGETAPEWMRRADAALYAAKNGGRNRAVIAEPG